MFESFVIMLREGVEVALVIGIILVVLKRSQRRDLERHVFVGVALAAAASIAAAVALNRLPVNEEAYEGVLYWLSAVFVGTMLWWMHRKARTIRSDIERRLDRVMVGMDDGHRFRESFALVAFAFLMVFREGAEAVMFLSAVNMTTGAMLAFSGSVLGLGVAVAFCVAFVRGSLRVDLRRFFIVTEWVLSIFIVQLLVNGYHEFSESGYLPATRKTMAVVGPIVRHNAIFILAMVSIPLFIWLSKPRSSVPPPAPASAAKRRLFESQVRRDRLNRMRAAVSALIVILAVGVVYANELKPRTLPPPELVARDGDAVVYPVEGLDDGKLHRLGHMVGGKMIRFLAMKTRDGRYRTALDACEICGSFGYVQRGENLLCLNCVAEINPLTIGITGGCNPIPLASEVIGEQVRVPVSALEDAAHLFPDWEMSGSFPTIQSGGIGVASSGEDRPGADGGGDRGDVAAMEFDPVCGMRLDPSSAAATDSFGGRTFYFCRPHCLETFRENPSEFVGSGK